LPKLRIKQGGGYARKGFIVLPPEEKPDEESFRYIAHEIAHLWWMHAPSASWEDWLNESFAEYSALMALRERFDDKTFREFLGRKGERIKDLPPILGLRREDEKAFDVLYNKGPLILSKLESRVGKQSFIRILREWSARKVRLTSEFMSVLGCVSSPKNRKWFEELLET
jgi:aminopeptidase N